MTKKNHRKKTGFRITWMTNGTIHEISDLTLDQLTAWLTTDLKKK